ncbi:MAG: sialate O-acetylesterase [Bacteroidales bacterium]|nr:sialate O-acetylesterase [Bacteroidales bacterium]
MKNIKLNFLAALTMLLGFVNVYAAPDPNFHIYLCFGQSNMEGQGNIESQDKTVDSRFQVLCSYDNCGSRKKGSWYDATPPLSCCSGQHLGPVDYFGRTLVKNLPENIKVGVVVVAIAGCDIQLFEKENYKSYRAESYMQSTIQSYGGNPYGRLVEMGKEAQKVGVIKGILLHQGETNTGQNNWPSRVKAIYNDLIKDLSLNAADVPLLVGEVVRSDQGGQCGSMNNIIANVPSTIPNSYVISAQGLGHKGDNLHFSSASYRTLGQRYAEQMQKVLKMEPSSNTSNEGEGETSQNEGSQSSSIDPCQMNTSMSSGQTATNGRRPIGNGFDLEMWAQSQQGSTSMQYTTKEGQFQFKANWNNPDDLLCRIGLFWDNGPKPSQLKGDIHCDFNYSYTGTGGGYHYIGVYGWTKKPNETEYYIVENTFNGNTKQADGLYWDARPENGGSDKGTYKLDGDTYRLLVGKRTGSSISGNSTFTQVYAIRQNARKCGHVSVSAHMREWEKKGVTLGELHDCKFLCEVGGGSGSFDMKYGNIWVGDASSSSSTVDPVTPSVPQGPYKEAFSVPGTVEAENYDVGGNGTAYNDTDDDNQGNAKYRTDEGVDIEKGGTGNAVGYTTSSEWLEYTIDVKKTSKYDVLASAANGSGDIAIDLYIDDHKVASLSGSQTDDNKWEKYVDLTATTSEIKSGKHILKVKFGSNNNNLDYIKFSEPDTTSHGEGHEGHHEGGETIIEAGKYPISYAVENTGANCEDPSSLNKNNLKSCKNLPNPFEWADGSGKVTDFCDWSCRRNEIKRELEYWELGEKPKFDKLEASYSGGTLTVKVYNGNNSLTLTSKLSIPSGNGPHPVVIGMDQKTGSLDASLFSKCIQLPFTHKQIAGYSSDGGRSQNDPFYKLYPGTFDTKADYCAWSWGISRLIDGLEIIKDQINADLGHIAVTGCSYAGKMALFAGALDERIALTISQESGGGGINAWRVSKEINQSGGVNGEKIEGIENTEYNWFLNSFKTNFESQIDKLPYDHHELIAMCAPRAFLAFGNTNFNWLGAPSGDMALKAAEEVWKAMGIEDRFGYVIDGGHQHCQASNSQNNAVKAFVGKFLYGDNSQNTKIRSSNVNPNYSTGKYDWGGHKIENNGCGSVDVPEALATGYTYLSQNIPNPTSDETVILFNLAEKSFVTIDLYNSLGVKVKSIVSDNYDEGAHEVSFSVSNLPQGFYYYVMSANGFVDSKSMIIK